MIGIYRYVLGVLVVALFWSPRITYAASWSVNPPSLEIRALPGTVNPNQIQIHNYSAQDLQISVEAKDITPVGEDGEIALTNSPKYALTPFLSFSPKTLQVGAKSSASVEVVATIPSDLKPGQRLGAVSFASPGQPDQLGLLLVNIPGAEMTTPVVAGFGPTQALNLEAVGFNLRISNPSQTYVKLAGAIKVYNLFGQEVASISLDPRIILGGATRRFDLSWPTPNPFGVFRAEFHATSDRNRSEITSTTYFAGLGVPALLPGAIGLLLVSPLILRRARRRQ